MATHALQCSIYGKKTGIFGFLFRYAVEEKKMDQFMPKILTIYGPIIYTASYVMCLMGANPLQGPLEWLGHESRDFFGPKKVEIVDCKIVHSAVNLNLKNY